METIRKTEDEECMYLLMCLFLDKGTIYLLSAVTRSLTE